MTSDVADAIDANCYAHQEGPRAHLGASQIGSPCARKLVYGFRHAVTVRHEGRMCRLFKRGHYEEPLVHEHLRGLGFLVRPFAQRLSFHPPTGSYAAEDWEQPMWPGTEDVTGIPQHVWVAENCAGIKLRQWSFKLFGGHFSGSNDGKIFLPVQAVRSFAGVPRDTWGLFENKTYNEKSFNKLLECDQDHLKLSTFKPEHYDQMQVYMDRAELTWALYVGVCKNDDRIHTIVVPYRPVVAARAVERARQAVSARQLPPRVSTYAGYVTCRFCDYKGVCHEGNPLEKKCRTCRHVVTVDDARFYCAKYEAIIPQDVERKGCDSWETVTD